MIYAKNGRFLLGGNGFSYAMFVDGQGFLQKLHFGGKIQPFDLDFLISGIGKIQEPPQDNPNREGYLDGMPSECPFWGRIDTCEPMITAVRSDGGVVSRFVYSSHRIYDGVPAVQGMPRARGGGQTLAVTLKDNFSPVEVTLNYTVWDELGVMVKNCEIANGGGDPIFLTRAFSFCCDFTDERFDVMRLWGDWGKERSPEISALAHGVTRLQSTRGVSSHQTNPFIALIKPNCSENIGECYGFQLVYSGSFALSAELGNKGQTRVIGGINDLNFRWKLDENERFVTPQAAICYSDEGLGGMSRAYADFIRAQIVNSKWVDARRPVLVNNWEATYFDFGNERLFPIVDEPARLGMDTFVLDDGWFGKRDDATSGLGDWFVNTNKLQGGLKPLIDRCKQRGLKFGLWFEPEMVSEDSDLFRAHPDWIIGKSGFEPVRQRTQLVLDFSRGEVVDYIFGAVSDVLKNNDIAYVKWDMNRYLSEFYSSALPADRQGELAHRYVLGVYRLAEMLTDAFPDVFFEGCASGGGRFDAGMLYYFPQIWTSDDTDGFERAKIQWGTSLCYPLSAMSCHVSACPNHQTGRVVPFSTRGNIASLGATGYELDLTKLSDEEKSQVAEQITEYKQIDGLVLQGDLYRLSSPFDSPFFCVAVVSKDKSRAYVVGERALTLPRDVNRIIRIYGLDDSKLYCVRELNLTASGAALKTAGLVAPKTGDFGSWTWHIEQVADRAGNKK